MTLQAIRGTNDFIYEEAAKMRHLENVFRKEAALYGFEEVKTPVFEYTELFTRGIGEETDIVSKEMYTFEDRGGRSITLRPEGTASIVRAYLEHSLNTIRNVNKMFYTGAMYRAERPQKGRYREFHQFGVEVMGSNSPLVDVEVISLNISYFNSLGLDNINLLMNTVGCPKCKPNYEVALKEYLNSHKDSLCDSCKRRYNSNVLRVLDCKNESCKEIVLLAPNIGDTVCDECKEHFDEVKKNLDTAKIKYSVNPRLVRGLDYYTKTVFEIQDDLLGAQNAVAGGGRYDNLIGMFNNGKNTPAVGSALGVERLKLALEERGVLALNSAVDVFVVVFKETKDMLLPLLGKARDASMRATGDYNIPSVKSQFKSANSLGASYVIVAGPDEVALGEVNLKNMNSGEEEKVKIDCLTDKLREKSI